MTDALHEGVCNHIRSLPILVSVSGSTVFCVRYLLRLKKQLSIERDGLKIPEYRLQKMQILISPLTMCR